MQALYTRMSTLTWVKKVEWKNIKTTMDGTLQSDIPYIQFYQNGTSYTHEQGRLVAVTQIIVEIVLKSDATNVYSQETLMDYQQEVLEKIGLDPNLGVAGVIHARVLSDDLDLHLLEPYYYGTLVFEVMYHTKFNSLCK